MVKFRFIPVQTHGLGRVPERLFGFSFQLHISWDFRPSIDIKYYALEGKSVAFLLMMAKWH